MISISVCDDDRSAVDEISRLAGEYFEEIGERARLRRYLSADELLGSGTESDVLFLDIMFERGTNGIEAARELRERGYGGDIIFLTVVPDAFPSAFEVGAFDYIVKPVEGDRFKGTMSRLMSLRRGSRDGRTALRCSGGYTIVSDRDIVFCEVIDKTLLVHLVGGGVVECKGTLSELAEGLSDGFFRCHRSYLVNLGYVTGRSGGDVLLGNGARAPISRLRTGEFDRAVMRLLQKGRQ